MARKPNYDYEKRRREAEKKAKKDAKREEKARRKALGLDVYDEFGNLIEPADDADEGDEDGAEVDADATGEPGADGSATRG